MFPPASIEKKSKRKNHLFIHNKKMNNSDYERLVVKFAVMAKTFSLMIEEHDGMIENSFFLKQNKATHDYLTDCPPEKINEYFNQILRDTEIN
jgi:hypothetical protein